MPSDLQDDEKATGLYLKIRLRTGVPNKVENWGVVTVATQIKAWIANLEVAAGGSVVALVYMRAFLPQSIRDIGVPAEATETDCFLEKGPCRKLQFFKTLPPFNDALCLLRTSQTFSQAAIAICFCKVAEIGLHDSLLYHLKAQFQFDKDQFADLMMIGGANGSISQIQCFDAPYGSIVGRT